MSENWLELAIIVFIVGGIGIAIWKGGAANPEGTGSLGRKMNKLQKDMVKLQGDVSGIDTRVTEIDRRSATTADIQGLERQVAEFGKLLAGLDESVGETRETLASQKATTDHTSRQVDRLYDFIVERGMSK